MSKKFSLVALSVLPCIAFAQTERELDSHEHGAGALNIAVDQGAVFIELEAPWENLVGFEHAPSNDEQQASVDEALAMLNEPDQLFTFEGSECEVGNIHIENSMGAHDDHHDEDHEESAHKDEHGDEHKDEHDDEHKDEHDEHKDEHGDEHEDEHKAEHDGHDEEGEGAHSAVLAEYEFTCADTGSLKSIGVEVFSTWQGFEDLDVQLVGPNGAGGLELNPDNTVVDLAEVN